MLSPAEQKLIQKVHENEHLIHQLGVLIPDIIYVLDLENNHFNFINDKVNDVMGADNIRLDKIHPSDHTPRRNHIAKCTELRPAQTLDMELRLLAKNGSWRWFNVRDTSYRSNKGGQTTHTVGIVSDIHLQKEQQQELNEHKMLLNGILDSNTVGIVIYKAIRNPDQHIVDFEFLATSTCFNRFHNRYDLKGKMLFSEFPRFRPALAETWRKIVNEGIVVHDKTNCPDPRTGQQHLFSLRYEKFGDGLMATYDDVTVVN